MTSCQLKFITSGSIWIFVFIRFIELIGCKSVNNLWGENAARILVPFANFELSTSWSCTQVEHICSPTIPKQNEMGILKFRWANYLFHIKQSRFEKKIFSDAQPDNQNKFRVYKGHTLLYSASQ